MKQFFTLLTTGILCLFINNSQAQFSQNFESITALSSNCWSFVNLALTSDPTEVISGSASLYSNPPTSASSTRDVFTPYLNITSTSFSVSFKYKLNSPLSGQAMRTVEVGLSDVKGKFTSLSTITLDRTTANQTAVNIFSQTFTLPATGVQQLVLRFGGNTGDGNTRMIIDELSASASPFYGPTTNCNSAPVAVNNTYTATSVTEPYVGSSVLSNDSDPNNETLTATLASQSLDGTVVLNADGTFIFTPTAGFAGSFTTFTYTVSDNGFTPLNATATVYIYFTQVTTLPLQLRNFSGAVGTTKTTLTWSVVSNSRGLLFEVQRSKNGSAFQPVATVFTSDKSGEAQYQFADALPDQTTRYRLKVVNKDGSSFYSPVVLFNAASAEGKIQLLQNPVQARLRFVISGSAMIKGIAIYNLSGAVMYSQEMGMQRCNAPFDVPVSNLKNGTYLLQVLTESGSKVVTFVKQ